MHDGRKECTDMISISILAPALSTFQVQKIGVSIKYNINTSPPIKQNRILVVKNNSTIKIKKLNFKAIYTYNLSANVLHNYDGSYK